MLRYLLIFPDAETAYVSDNIKDIIFKWFEYSTLDKEIIIVYNYKNELHGMHFTED